MNHLEKVYDIHEDSESGLITINPKCMPKGTLIWLHGRGGYRKYIDFLTSPSSPVYVGFRVKMLAAPQKSITVQKGQVVRAWYNVKKLNRTADNEREAFDFPDIEDSAEIIKGQIRSEITFYMNAYPNSRMQANRRVYLGGISQGAVMSLYTGMMSGYLLGGIISSGGYIFHTVNYKNIGHSPILLIHGEKDELISAKDGYRFLLENQNVEYQQIPGMKHFIQEEAIKRIQDWMVRKSRSYEGIVQSKL